MKSMSEAGLRQAGQVRRFASDGPRLRLGAQRLALEERLLADAGSRGPCGRRAARVEGRRRAAAVGELRFRRRERYFTAELLDAERPAPRVAPRAPPRPQLRSRDRTTRGASRFATRSVGRAIARCERRPDRFAASDATVALGPEPFPAPGGDGSGPPCPRRPPRTCQDGRTRALQSPRTCQNGRTQAPGGRKTCQNGRNWRPHRRARPALSLHDRRAGTAGGAGRRASRFGARKAERRAPGPARLANPGRARLRSLFPAGARRRRPHAVPNTKSTEAIIQA